MSVKTSKPIHSHIGDGQICVLMPRNRPLTATRTSTPSALVVYWSYQSILSLSNDCNLEFWNRLALFIFSKGRPNMVSRRASLRLTSGCWIWCTIVLATTESSLAVLEDQYGPSTKHSLRNVVATPTEAAIRRSENRKAAPRRNLQENDPQLPPLLLSDPPSPPPSLAFNTTGTATMQECRVPQVRAPAVQGCVGRLAAVSHICLDSCSHSLCISIPMPTLRYLVCRRLDAV
jgi:hypothetical protein